MKESRYNHIQQVEKHKRYYIAYNTLTNALALMETKQYNELLKVRHNNTGNLNPEIIQDLTYGGYIINDDFDELKYIEFRNGASKFDKSVQSLTIAVTMNCNFCCPYCYEETLSQASDMSAKIQDTVISYIQSEQPRSLHITWYGGEPLLAQNVIVRMTKQITQLCDNEKIIYDSDIVTNGYLLTEDVSRMLKDNLVKSVQITIDGPEQVHNSRRYLKGGGNTYRKIMDNIASAYDKLYIYLRINVDRSNASQLEDLVADLRDRGILEYIHPYLGHIENRNNNSSSDCFTRKEFAKLEYSFFDILDKYSTSDRWSYKNRLPSLLYNRCISDTVNGYVIDPDGDMYKCWNHVGYKGLAVGNIERPIPPSKRLFDYTLSRDCYEKPCVDCGVLPLCGGGCLDTVVRDSNKRCCVSKFILDTFLQDVANQMIDEIEHNESDILVTSGYSL